jgi:ComF family protein
MTLVKEIRDALLHLAFPHICAGCGSDAVDPASMLCLRCMEALPLTHFHLYGNNPVEKIFWGRIPLKSATSQYYFTGASLMQRLMHQLKYGDNQDLGYYLGTLMGSQLASSNRYVHCDALVPLPLHGSRERKRGYNQAAVLCEGIASVLKRPVITNAVTRTRHTDTQTKKSRVARYQNMEGRFELSDARLIEGKHILLVDDVVTTGATLEACGRQVLEANGIQLSIATLCYSSG